MKNNGKEMVDHSWLDKYMAEQQGNREQMKKVVAPYSIEEVSEAMSESDEVENVIKSK